MTCHTGNSVLPWFAMNKTDKIELPNPDEARSALASVEQFSSTGLKRGLYPRWFAVAMSLWAGVLAATVGMAVWLLIFGGGLIGYWLWRRRVGAWVREINSRADLWRVITLSIVFGGLFVGGYVGRYHYELPWAPIVAGVVVAIGLYVTTEIAYRPVRTRFKSKETA